MSDTGIIAHPFYHDDWEKIQWKNTRYFETLVEFNSFLLS